MDILRWRPTNRDCFRIAGHRCTRLTNVGPFQFLSRAANIFSYDDRKALDCLTVCNSKSRAKDAVRCCFNLFCYGEPVRIAINVIRTLSLVPV